MSGAHIPVSAEPAGHFPVAEGIVMFFLDILHDADKVIRHVRVTAFQKPVVTSPVNSGYGAQKAYCSDSSFKDGFDCLTSFFFKLLPRSMPSSFDSSS